MEFEARLLRLTVRECITDNPARTVQRLKEILHKRDCRIAPVSYLFEKKGIIAITKTAEGGFDELFEVGVEGGAEDVRETEGEEGSVYEVSVCHFDVIARKDNDRHD
jgi:transcriptional/translational regulatory protein YebC/TACO1